MSIKTVYTAKATATGGRDGSAVIHDGDLEIKLALPPAMGGNGKGNNPEQLFAAGYAACFIGAMKAASAQDKSLAAVPSEVSIDSAVGIGPRAEGGFGLEVTLTVSLPGVDPAEARRLVDAGHQVCPYSNATRGNIEVTLNLV